MSSTSTDLTASTAWRAARAPLLVGGVVLLGALLLALVAGEPGSGRLDPRAPEPAGGRALAQVLGDLGVDVERRTTLAGVQRSVAGAEEATVLVTDPGLLVESQVEDLRATGADLVVLAPPDPSVFDDAVGLDGPSPAGVRLPGCRLPAAARAGAADSGILGFTLAPGTDAETCYARDGVPSLVRLVDGATLTLLGNPEPFTNDRLDDEGNAALVLGLLGQDPTLVWYLPSLADVPRSAQERSFYDLVPDGVWWGLGQLAVAVVLLGLWRARRLGPVVPEPLPVVVRAAETTEGRARLYRRAGARDTAAESLRTAARRRLAAALGVPTVAGAEALVDAVAGRSRRAPGEVGALLYGHAPTDDAALVRFADELDALDREVRRP